MRPLDLDHVDPGRMKPFITVVYHFVPSVVTAAVAQMTGEFESLRDIIEQRYF